MSRRAFTLPLRIVSSSAPPSRNQPLQSWICQRCLSTQTSPTPLTTPPPTASVADANSDSSASAEWRTAQILATPLKHRIPPQYLQHSTSPFLHKEEIAQREAEGLRTHTQITGVVIDAGKMDKTVKVRIVGRRWEKRIGKYYISYTNHLVHDPNSSLVIGDLISLHRLRISSAVHHVVASIVAPFGTPVSARAPIPSPDDRLAAYKAKRLRKFERRDLRARAAEGDEEAVREIRERGLEIGGAAKDGEKDESEDTKAEQGRADRKARKLARKEGQTQRAARKVERRERRQEREAGEMESAALGSVASETPKASR
nr:hypothetical protein CFP56_71908 [Quercus suber]